MRNKERIKERYEDAKLAYTALMLLYPLTLEDLPCEIWEWIDGYEGLYQVSTFGRIKSFYRGKIRILKPMLNKNCYLNVNLYKYGKYKTIGIHILVARTFISNPFHKPEVNHIFGNKFDNYFENLEWATTSENTRHAYLMGLKKSGVDSYQSKLTEEQVRWIRENYIPRDKEFGAMALAKNFDLTEGNILKVIYRKTYKNVE